MRIETIKPHSYRNKDKKPGDKYEADEKFGRALVDAGIARRYNDREMLPESPRAIIDEKVLAPDPPTRPLPNYPSSRKRVIR